MPMHQVTYARGWSDGLVGRLSETEAAQRDRTGDPYVAVIHDAEGAVVVLGVARALQRLEVRRLDRLGRTTALVKLADPGDGTVFVREYATWDHPAADGPADHRRLSYFAEGGCLVAHEPRGAGGGRSETFKPDVEQLIVARPDFGAWAGVVGLVEVSLDGPVASDGAGLPVGSGEPWTPGLPLQPGDVAARLRDGSEHRCLDRVVRVHEQPAGRVRLTSGRVLAADPGWLGGNREAGFTAAVPPGTYPVVLSLVATDEQWAEGRAAVAAATLRVRDVDVVRWELALKPGEDPLYLGDGEFYGMGVDTGTGAFLDADAADDLADVYDDGGWQALEEAPGPYVTVGDDAMVMFRSGDGDGSYPVWIGRGADGEVACFVADMLLIAP